MPDGYLNKTPLFQFILLSCLFPLWGCAAALNDILITQFKSVFSLSNFASALVQSAFYGGYFLIAIPASLVIKKTSYKVAILIGLTLYIGGCTLFFPASHMATYTMPHCGSISARPFIRLVLRLVFYWANIWFSPRGKALRSRCPE